jgi:hypothetical protein
MNKPVVSAAEQVVGRQSAEIVERTAVGIRTGTFAVSHLGRRLGSPLVRFALTSKAAEVAFDDFRKALSIFKLRRNDKSALALATSATLLDDMLGKAGLRADDVAAMRKELNHHYLTALQTNEEGIAAAERVLAANRRVRSFVSKASVEVEVAAAKAYVKFLDVVAGLSHAGAKPTATDMAFLRAYREIDKVIGADLDGGWRPAIDYLLKNKEAVKAYRKELERLESVIAKETNQAKLEQLNKAFQAERKQGVHSVTKGKYLGEAYASRLPDWRLFRTSYMDLAKQVIARRPELAGFVATPVTGGMFLGPEEVWDEAILLLRRGSNIPEAKVFLARQVNVRVEPVTLSQTLKDISREASNRSLRIVRAEAPEEWYLLSPLPPGERTHRWVANALGGEFPKEDIAALYKRGVEVHQQPMPMTVDEFNLVTDYLIKAVADVLP